MGIGVLETNLSDVVMTTNSKTNTMTQTQDLSPISAYFNAQRDRLKQQHPEWFPDFDGEMPFDEIGDLSLRAEERLVFLQKQIKAISQELIGTKTEDDDPSWYDQEKESLINKMRAALDQSNQRILSWVAIVGIALAIILLLS